MYVQGKTLVSNGPWHLWIIDAFAFGKSDPKTIEVT